MIEIKYSERLFRSLEIGHVDINNLDDPVRNYRTTSCCSPRRSTARPDDHVQSIGLESLKASPAPHLRLQPPRSKLPADADGTFNFALMSPGKPMHSLISH